MIVKYFQGLSKIFDKTSCSEKFVLDFENKEIWHSESPFHQILSKFYGEKALSNYFKVKNLYLESAENVIGFDHGKGKADSTQYIPIFSTLKTLLQQDVLWHGYEAHSIETDTMTTNS